MVNHPASQSCPRFAHGLRALFLFVSFLGIVREDQVPEAKASDSGRNWLCKDEEREVFQATGKALWHVFFIQRWPRP